MKLSTINQIVEAILAQEPVRRINWDKAKHDRYLSIANEATIYLKTAMICESNGIDKAMEYFTGTHSEDEYQEFRTGVIEK